MGSLSEVIANQYSSFKISNFGEPIGAFAQDRPLTPTFDQWIEDLHQDGARQSFDGKKMLQLAGEVADGVVINMLGERFVPKVVAEVRKGGDYGRPIVVSAPESPAGQAFQTLVPADSVGWNSRL